MARLSDIRKAALALPGVNETHWKGPIFRYGKKGFIYNFADEGRWLFKLPHTHQELLWEVRPEVYSRFTAGAMIWTWVKIEELPVKELRPLVIEAWEMVAPKKVSRPYLERTAAKRGS
jgi:hypothetical protein